MSTRPRIKDLGRWKSGGTPPRDDPDAWNGDLPWLSAKDIDRDNLRPPTAFITEEAARMHSQVIPESSVLLVVRGMALAHGLPVVLTDRRAAFNQDLRALVPDPQHDPRFLHYSFRGNRLRFGAHIDRAAHGTARVIDSLYVERIWAPSLDEQREIADGLDRESHRVAQLRRILTGSSGPQASGASLSGRLTEYRDALITEAVTGQLDVTTVSENQMDERLHEAVEAARVE